MQKLEKDDTTQLMPKAQIERIFVFIGEDKCQLAAAIVVHHYPGFTEEGAIEDCLNVWSRDLAGTIAATLNKVKEV